MSFRLELRSVLFAQGKNIILNNIDLTVEPGSVFLFGGKSGCGKSALLEICAGLLKPQKGKILWNGDDVTNVSKYELYERRRSIGYVFQTCALIANHTVFDNIELPLKCGGNITSAKRRTIVYETMDEFGIERDIEKKFPETLSVAQQKRVAIARALVDKPKLLLMDEPLAGIDPITSDAIMNVIKKRWERDGMSVVMATNKTHASVHWNTNKYTLENGALEIFEEAQNETQDETQFEQNDLNETNE